LADVKPLNVSESGWKPMSRDKKEINERSPEMVTRKIKSLLNKLTLENFDSVSAKIVEIANYSEDEPDGATLKLVIQLLFEKATDEPNFSSMWAQLANKMLANISTEVEDKSVLTREGVPMCGGVLFRKYLLNRCQEEFEKGWKVEIPKNPTEDYLMSDEYYTAAKAKRRGLGLVEFIGELFKLGMLTEKIMHECVRRLLSNVQDPEEEETESMAKLMSTIGKMLDHREARNYLNAYFHRIQELSVNQKLSSRIRFMLLDLIELRNDKWIPRHTAAGPKTIAQIHEEALKQK
ncbi:armadillo-type protein, partial [Syncephalis plumigaleata]